MKPFELRDATRNVFGGSYWGYCGSGEDVQEIFANRLKFYQDFFLKRALDRHSLEFSFGRDGEWDVDHLEAYSTDLGKGIVICSNYCGTPPPPEMMMTPYIPLYSLRTTTFIREYEQVADIRKHAKACRVIHELRRRDQEIATYKAQRKEVLK